MDQPSLFAQSPPAADQRLVAFNPDFAGWQAAARSQLAAGRRPESLWWTPDPTAAKPANPDQPIPVPRRFMELARPASCHRASDRWALLYAVLWRLTHGERHLLQLAGDPQTARLHTYAKTVRRDVHKMKAFVRFREVAEPEHDEPRYVAWFEPDHHIVAYASGFFRRRFANMRWSILTPTAAPTGTATARSGSPPAPTDPPPPTRTRWKPPGRPITGTSSIRRG